jgi:hypothetical protein
MKKKMSVLEKLIKEVMKEQSVNSTSVISPNSPPVTTKELPYNLDSPSPVLSLDKARQIGKYLGVDFNKIKVEDFYQGMQVETEHKDLDSTPNDTMTIKDWVMYAKIAKAHLEESPNYYTELSKMEKKMKKESLVRNAIRKIIKEVLSENDNSTKIKNYVERIKKLNDKISKSKNPEEKRKLTQTRAKAEENRKKLVKSMGVKPQQIK